MIHVFVIVNWLRSHIIIFSLVLKMKVYVTIDLLHLFVLVLNQTSKYAQPDEGEVPL
jgi:hypothetical protein